MEANLCLPTRHFPAMRHHKNVLVHSRVRLPALQAKVGPPPGAARVAAVGAGVVLACALGAMYWKRARALQLPMHRSSQTSHEGGNGGDHQARGISPKDLHDQLSEICITKLDPKPPQLTKLIHQGLTEMGAQNVSQNQDLTSLLEEIFSQKTPPGESEYNWGFVLILALISEKKYTKAEEICNKLRAVAVDSQFDAKPDILLDIINMMMAMESMLQFPNTTSTSDLKVKLEQVEKAWERYKSKPDFPGGPPATRPTID